MTWKMRETVLPGRQTDINHYKDVFSIFPLNRLCFPRRFRARTIIVLQRNVLGHFPLRTKFVLGQFPAGTEFVLGQLLLGQISNFPWSQKIRAVVIFFIPRNSNSVVD